MKLSSIKSFTVRAAAVIGATLTLSSTAVFAEIGEPEKDELKVGFIKLTDMAPIAIAVLTKIFLTTISPSYPIPNACPLAYRGGRADGCARE